MKVSVRKAIVRGGIAVVMVSGALLTGAAPASAANPQYCAVAVIEGRKAATCGTNAGDVRAWATGEGRKIVLQAWQHPDYQGSWFMVTMDKSRCTASTGDRDIAIYNFGMSWTMEPWNNRISSLKTDLKTDLTSDTRCSVHLFDGTTLTGASKWIHYYHRQLSQIGWDNRASSLVIT